MKKLFYSLAVAVNIVALVLIVLGVGGLLWYSPESGWCIGTLNQCLKP